MPVRPFVRYWYILQKYHRCLVNTTQGIYTLVNNTNSPKRASPRKRRGEETSWQAHKTLHVAAALVSSWLPSEAGPTYARQGGLGWVRKFCSFHTRNFSTHRGRQTHLSTTSGSEDALEGVKHCATTGYRSTTASPTTSGSGDTREGVKRKSTILPDNSTDLIIHVHGDSSGDSSGAPGIRGSGIAELARRIACPNKR